MNWLYYLLEANLYLAVFYGFYRLLLHRETFYSLNRYYLLSATLLAFILPVLQVGYLQNFFDNGIPTEWQQDQLSLVPVSRENQTAGMITTESAIINPIVAVYFLICLVFLSKLLYSLGYLLRLFKSGRKEYHRNFTLVQLHNNNDAFSFFNLVFLNPNLPEKEIILKHEMAHVTQRHSLDVLLVECIQIVSWFNPITYLLKKDIKLIHEYLADEATANGNLKKHDYAIFLIEHSYRSNQLTLFHQIFNPSVLKMRISMLNKERSAKRTMFRFLLTIPLVGMLICVSTIAFAKDFAYIDLFPKLIKYDKGSSLVKFKDQKKPKTMRYRYKFDKKTGQYEYADKRLFVINGKITPNKDFKIRNITNIEKLVELTPTEAIARYGSQAKLGAVEFIGDQIKINDYTGLFIPPSPKLMSKK